MALYHPSLPCGIGARVKRTSSFDALNMMRMSLSSRSASISDLFPSITSARVRRAGGPVRRLRLLGQPRNVGNGRVRRVLSIVELGPQECGMAQAESDELPAEAMDIRMSTQESPIVPGDFIVLAPRVVVASLCAAELVASQDHRRAEGKEEGGEEVLHLPVPDRLDQQGPRWGLRLRSLRSDPAWRRPCFLLHSPRCASSRS